MNIKNLWTLLLAALVIGSGEVVAQSTQYNASITPSTQHNTITPAPVVAVWGEESVDLCKGLSLYIAAEEEDAVRLEAAACDMGIELRSVRRPARKGYLNLEVVPAAELAEIVDMRYAEEGYVMDITAQGVSIKAPSAAGLYYGLQSLAQIYETEGRHTTCHVADAPRFGYRGVLIDISRHFRTKEFLMRQIDQMAAVKMNRLHLHLTDAAGWRLEVESYPRLTSYAAWRTPDTWKEWWYGDRRHVDEGTEGAYGGYLTKAEARELVAYAADRYITIIPEIEMPGHSDEVLAAYPELRCTQQPERQGDLCIGKEATFEMMQAILDEVIEIFPSEYIHIGGDEAGKSSWKECDDCRRRMEEEGLESVDELQSYMIHRIEEYLNARGRQIIGWDEILEGGLAPNATVMSWRGEEGGIAAAAAGHDAIMSPHGYCYIDAPQDAPYSQPESIGGYLPLEKVYSYEPTPESMDESVARHIIGVQANLWAEFIPTDKHYEHMLWPRAIAVAEIGWSQPEHRDFALFRERAVRIVDDMLERGYTPFDLKNEIGNRPESLEPVEHLAVGKSVSYLYPSFYYAPQYAAAGDATLTDGLRGTWTYADKRWQGFLGRGGVDVIVDMGEVTHVESIAADFMQICGPGVFMPCRVEIWGSVDGENYELLTDIEHEVVVDELPSFKSFGWEGSADVRYIRYKAHRSKFSGFLFTDEIIVR
ncbi:MAG: beta-N-acetylhexosaminidase [Alistipes sp.]|nr:beta-N-acetylhexosaminidase [Alistipes sp.]